MGLQRGQLAVRRSAFIQASPERVWQEFTSFEGLRAWFGTPFAVPGRGTGHTLEAYDPRPGGNVRLSVGIEGERRAFGGRIVAFEPCVELSFEDNWEPPHADPVPTYITFRLTPLYGGTHVELLHHGFERFGADAGAMLEGYESGWHSLHLEALRAIAEA
jgi:uncharacterized protein YndB with AHSA1/START domain